MGLLDKIKRSMRRSFTEEFKALDRYALQSVIGSGSAGKVWLATDQLLNRPVAIKYLKSTDSAVKKELFLSEAQMLAQLNHPNITLIYDATFDQKNSQFYLVMEYVEGQSLSTLLAERSEPLPMDAILNISIGIAQALHSAHEQGIVHRDVKPANVLLRDNQVKLTDFGVAGLISILSKSSRVGVGSLYYMSPEQLKGGEIDGRADLYAFGIVLFEMLSNGQVPFDLNSREAMIEAHLSQPPPSIRTVAANTPLALERMILRLLAKEPADRYPTAQAVLKSLSSFQARQKFNQPRLNLIDDELGSFVGREQELEQLNDIWTQSQSLAAPRLVVVQANMGMGKTSLITKFLADHVIDEGFTALAGRCNKSGMPYAAFAEIMATVLRTNLDITIPQSQIDQLLGHMPGLARLINVTGAWQVVSLEGLENISATVLSARWQFFNLILNILTELGPTALFLEDADLLDEAGADLVQFLIRQPQLPLLIIAACQDDGQPIPWLNGADAEAQEIIRLDPLSSPAIRKHLDAHLDGPVPDEVVTLVEQQSQGKILQIDELTHELLDSKLLYRDNSNQWRHKLPDRPNRPPALPGLKAGLGMFGYRIDRLSEDTRRALAFAALIESGPEFELDLWLALLAAMGDEKRAKAALEEALAQRVVRRVTENRYTFFPTDLHQVFVKNLPADRLPELHYLSAEILRQIQSDPLIIGYHYEQAGLAIEAAYFLEEAGANMLASNAINSAVECYSRVVALVDSLSAYKKLGNLYRRQGQWDESLLAYQQALILAEQSDNINEKAQLLNGLSFTLWLYDDYLEAYEPAQNVLTLAGVSEVERATAQSHLGMISWISGDLAEAERWCQKSLATLEQSNTPVSLGDACNRLGLVHFSQGKLAEAETLFQRSLGLRQELQDLWGQGYCLVNIGQVAIERGDFETATLYIDQAEALLTKVGSDDGLMVVYTNRGLALQRHNQPQEALTWLQQAQDLALKIGKYSTFGLCKIFLHIAQANLALGRTEIAQEYTNDALELAQTTNNREYLAASFANLAHIHAALGNQIEAGAMFQQAIELYQTVGSQIGRLRTQFDFAQFLSRHGEPDRAKSLSDEAQAAAKKLGAAVVS